MDAGSARTDTPDVGYSGGAVAGAVLVALFVPFISVIAALLLQGGQENPRKKAQLRAWAWVSLGWLAFGVLMTVLLVSVGSGSGSGL
ncbi:MAG TPA: hypothetical protein VIC70_06215 [Gaiellaceae bacterium]|jgi:hypothetical protein